MRIRRTYNHSPFITRLAIIHVPTTFVALALMPPAPQVPVIAIPIVWAASFCLAYTLAVITRFQLRF